MLASSCPIEVLGIFWGGTSLGVSSLIALTSFAFTKTTFFRLSTKKLRNYLVRSTTWLTQHCTEHTEQHHHHHTTNNRHNILHILETSDFFVTVLHLYWRLELEFRIIGRESDGCQQHWTGSGLLVWATITLYVKQIWVQRQTLQRHFVRRLIVFPL